jgi:hypothetical protein
MNSQGDAAVEQATRQERAAMDGFVVHGGLGMARGSTTRIEDGKGILVYVWEGELWITQAGDRRDYFVRRGEWFQLDRDGATLLHALERTQATLTAPTPTDYASLISVTPAGTVAPRLLYQRSQHGGWLDGLKNRVRPLFQYGGI